MTKNKFYYDKEYFFSTRIVKNSSLNEITCVNSQVNLKGLTTLCLETYKYDKSRDSITNINLILKYNNIVMEQWHRKPSRDFKLNVIWKEKENYNCKVSEQFPNNFKSFRCYEPVQWIPQNASWL